MNKYSYTNQSLKDIEKQLDTSFTAGLSQQEARKRQQHYGPNSLAELHTYAFTILLRQFASPFIYLLIVAALISFFLSDKVNAILILVIITLNGLLSFIQEYRAEKTVRLLKEQIPLFTKVIRGNQALSIKSTEVVPGDSIVLEPGDLIPADMRLIETTQLTVDESALTGESVPVPKNSDSLKTEAKNIYQAENMVFSGTRVITGSARAVVIAIGDKTHLGSISHLALSTQKESAFQKRIANLSNFIVRLILITIVALLLFHIALKGSSTNLVQLLLFVISLAITVTPEGLPVVTTFSLSQGALALARHNVIVKRLAAIEDLGSITVLCTDKTGTLTENNLSVQESYALSPKDNPLLYALLASADSAQDNLDPFDTALWAKASSQEKEDLKTYTLISALPFDPERKRNTVIVKQGANSMLISRGAFERLTLLSTPLSQETQQKIQAWLEQQATNGRRVIALASKKLTNRTADITTQEHNLTLIGLISFYDPIKPTARQAVIKAHSLQIALKMITGDSKEVACSVAEKIHLIPKLAQDCAITGSEFEQLSLAQQQNAVQKYTVFARISPEQKYTIVNLLKTYGTVGFLGDGINDAPALKAAHVSIVVQSGSALAKDMADIVLLEKSLLSIIQGIEIGRKVFINTLKYIRSVLASTFGNFYSVSLASLLIDFLPMLPIQMLLVNLLSDIPMISIATDTVDPEEVKSPPVYDLKGIAFSATLFGIVCTLVDCMFFVIFYKYGASVLQTNWFIESVLTELVLIYSLRTKKLFYTSVRPSWLLIVLSLVTALSALLLPFTYSGQQAFKFVQPTANQLSIIILLVIGYFFANEVLKRLYYKWSDKTNDFKKIHR